MVRIISQETYDEVVRENLRDFDMSPEEAVEEAVAQFTAQGVDLSNIIKDLVFQPDNQPILSKAIIRMKKIGIPASDADEEALISELNIIRIECRKGLAYRVRAVKEGAYKDMMRVLEVTHKRYLEMSGPKDGAFLPVILCTLTALTETQPDLLNNKGVDYIISALDFYEEKKSLCGVLKWTRTCCTLHEMNKQKLYANRIGNILKKIIRTNRNIEVLINSLQLLRKFTMDDDIRVEYSKRYERTKGLANILLTTVTDLLRLYTKPPLVSELMLTISCLLVCEELCVMFMDSVEVFMSTLAENYDVEAVVKNAAILITAATGSDRVKNHFIKCRIIPVMISVLSRHMENASVSSSVLQAIGSLTRREPAHSKQFLDNGAAEAIVECMHRHENDPEVLKFACRAIRDMVARYREQNAKFHELGVEALLKRANGKFDGKIDYDIRAALRDLDCDVQLEEQWTGKGVQMEQ